MKLFSFIMGGALLSLLIFSCNEIESSYEKQVKEDDKKLRDYLESSNIEATMADEGYFYEVIVENPNGDLIEEDDIVEFFYSISLLNGAEIESNMGPEDLPLLFKKQSNGLWPSGLEKGTGQMRVGEHYRFYLPSYLAYYTYGHNDFFPAFSNFIIDIKINAIKTENEMNDFQSDLIDDFIEEADYTNVESKESGLKYIKTEEGTGDRPTSNDYVKISWTRKYLDGTILKSTGTSAYDYHLGSDYIVEGLKEGILLMQEGEEAIFIMPSKLAFNSSLQVIPHELRSELYQDGSILFDVEPYTPILYEIKLEKVY